MRIKYNYVVIEGNIGAGKTTLATKIAEQFNAHLVLEGFADNPFLPKFYNDPAKYSFPLELSFLADRYRQIVTTAFVGQDFYTAGKLLGRSLPAISLCAGDSS